MRTPSYRIISHHAFCTAWVAQLLLAQELQGVTRLRVSDSAMEVDHWLAGLVLRRAAPSFTHSRLPFSARMMRLGG
jgi:hypothetical protein